jgi:tRNA modification GTPase
MDPLMKDTIAAVSTPPGEGGIGIVRLSGSLATEIARKMFVPAIPAPPAPPFEHGRVRLGWIGDPETGERVDQVMLTFMKSPRSYTTQDVVEISCHGGPGVLEKVLSLAICLGARPAGPGEFTQRAFLGGRIDLAQAEAVMDLIRSRTDLARHAAMCGLSGDLSRRLEALRGELTDLLVELEVRMDFCEDEIPPLGEGFRRAHLDSVAEGIDALLGSFRYGQICREGVRACIAGPPNAGKSTLLNTLLGRERAIVTEFPGTTRDMIEEPVSLDGVPLILTDTAGIRESDDPVESIGVGISLKSAGEAQIILLVLDASSPHIPCVGGLLDGDAPGKTIVVANKIDLGLKYPRHELDRILPGSPVVEVSLKEGVNVDALKAAILQMIWGGAAGAPPGVILSNARHRDALQRARQSLARARDSLNGGLPDDFLTIDLQAALDSIGEITGKVMHRELMDMVFSRFCIGK